MYFMVIQLVECVFYGWVGGDFDGFFGCVLVSDVFVELDCYWFVDIYDFFIIGYDVGYGQVCGGIGLEGQLVGCCVIQFKCCCVQCVVFVVVELFSG